MGHYKEMDAGHFQTRAFHGTRYDEKNTNLQCRFCNRFREGCGPDYFLFMQDKYGDDVIDKIRKNKLRCFTAWELEEDIKHYQEKVKEMV